MKSLLSWVLSLTVLILVTGCDTRPKTNYDLVDLINGHGTITLDGEPLADAVITMEAKDGQYSYAMTDGSGQYTLQFDTVKKGVTPGKKIVRISTTRKILGLNVDEEEGDGDVEGEGGGEGKKKLKIVEQVPAKYNKQSELTTEVTSDKTQYDFDLSSK